MSVRNRHKCLVCGRSFPSGQGVIIKVGSEVLEFHSNRCFAKFAKSLLERVPPDEIRGYLKKLKDEYEDVVSQKLKRHAKKI